MRDDPPGNRAEIKRSIGFVIRDAKPGAEDELLRREVVIVADPLKKADENLEVFSDRLFIEALRTRKYVEAPQIEMLQRSDFVHRFVDLLFVDAEL